MKTQSFEQQFRARTPRSQALFEEASQVLPGGVAGNGKFMQPYPVYVNQAQGARLVDADGNQYIDLLMGAGVHILGHSPEIVLDAVHSQLSRGAHYYMPAEPEIELAKKVCQLMPSVDMVRFVNTGSEATQMALRAARAYRRRDKVAKFEGNFHGQHESVLISTLGTAGSPGAPETHVDSAGVPQVAAEDVLVLPYNDADQAASLIAEHADQLGAVIMEPVSAFGLGCVVAEPSFLRAVRQVTAEQGIPLIFDEVVTNFRLALGGAAEYFGIEPDLVCLGKILGGGFAIGGYGGRREIMDKVVTPTVGLWDLKEQIFQSGCFSGNPVSMVAGLSVLLELEKGDIIPRINALTDRLCAGLREIGERRGADMLVTSAASMLQIHFGVQEIKNKRDALKEDKERSKQFHLGLRANGVMASAHPLFLSVAHTEDQVDRVLDIVETVLAQMS